MATIKGKWKLKDTLSAPDADIEQAVSFESTITSLGETYTVKGSNLLADVASGRFGLTYTYTVPSLSTDAQVITPYTSSVGWDTTDYAGLQTVDFGDTEQEVSAEFYSWFTQNATEVSPSGGTVLRAGTYRFNDVLSAPSGSENVSIPITFEPVIVTLDGMEYACPTSATAIVITGLEDGAFMLHYSGVSPEDVSNYPLVYVNVEGVYWNALYQDMVENAEVDVSELQGWGQTITLPTDQEVSAEFAEWFTANTNPVTDDGGDDEDKPETTPAATIQYNGSVIASLNGGQTATLKCEGMRMESNVVVKAGASAGRLGPLTVVENGTYDAAYDPAAVTWDENTEYDFSVTMDDITLRVKKAADLSVPADARYFADPAYSVTLKLPDGTEQAIPLRELSISDVDGEGGGYTSNDLMYAVVWIRHAALFNELVGQAVFEDNAVYITDFFWVLEPESFAGMTFTLTAPGKKLDGISSVEVAVESSGGGADLNIAYGDTEPEDTTKLWVKADKPNSVIISTDFDGVEALKTGLANAPITSPGWANTSVAAVGTKIYVFTYNSKVIYVYDTETGAIRTLSATLPTSLNGERAAVIGSKIYLFGHRGGYTDSSLFGYVYDIETDTVSTLGNVLVYTLGDAAAVSVGEKIYLFGGNTSTTNNSYTANIYVFDPKTKTTGLVARMPMAMDRISAVAIGTKVYLFGGRCYSTADREYVYYNKIYVYDTETGAIRTLSATLPNAKCQPLVAAVGSKIYLFGGYNGTAIKSIDVYDIETDTIETLTMQLPIAVYGYGAVAMHTQIYLFDSFTVNSFSVNALLPAGAAQIVPSITDNICTLINSDGLKMKIGVAGVYIGNSEGYAELTSAYRYTGIEEITSLEGIPPSSAVETTSGTELTGTIDCNVGDLIVAAIATRDTLTLSDGWTLISTSGINSADTTGNGQRLSWAWKIAASTTESITVTQASAQRLYINMVALHGATGVTDNGYSYRDDTTSGNITVDKPAGLVLWGLTSNLWGTTAPYSVWTASNNAPIIQLGEDAQSRLGIALDQSEDESVTFTGGSSATPMIVGSLTVQGMDKFYTDNSYLVRVWENVNTGEKLTFNEA